MTIVHEKLPVRYTAYKKVREAIRDLLFVKYGGEWREYEKLPLDSENQLLDFLVAFAEGDESARKAVGCAS